MSRLFCLVDYETFSCADLPTCGAWEYAVEDSTEIVCVAWKEGTRETLRSAKTHIVCPLLGWGSLEQFKKVMQRDTYKVAHNAGFDRLITHHVLGVPQKIEDWIDTAALAAAHALPRSLEGACDALELSRRKNTEGKKLVNRYSKPKRPSKKDPSTRHTDREGLERFARYCADDVEAMVELFLYLPPLSPEEREVYKLNQRINHRGVQTDQKLLGSAISLIAKETAELNTETKQLTGGTIDSATQRARVVEFVRGHGFAIPDLTKLTVESALSSGLVTGRAKRLLEIREAISKSSTAKYLACRHRTRSDGRLRDLQLYHGASTGRESGMGFQPHNLPKPTTPDVDTAIECIKTGDLEWVRCLCGNPMEALASSIRGVLVPTPGYEFFSADFNAIEARVVLWLAGDEAGLRTFESGDPYKTMAATIFRKRVVEDVTDQERDLGKRVILGCGFGMGWKKFWLTSKLQGKEISEQLAKVSVAAYRKERMRVRFFWKSIEQAAVLAVQHPGRRIPMPQGKLHWMVRGKFLYCELPSGRRIAYFKPHIKMEPSPWGSLHPKLYRYFVHPQKRIFVRGATYGGELTENVVQATARDLMVASQLRTEKVGGYTPLFSVHDECNAEKKKGAGSCEEFTQLMSETPAWAKGLPVKVKAWTGERYRK